MIELLLFRSMAHQKTSPDCRPYFVWNAIKKLEENHMRNTTVTCEGSGKAERENKWFVGLIKYSKHLMPANWIVVTSRLVSNKNFQIYTNSIMEYFHPVRMLYFLFILLYVIGEHLSMIFHYEFQGGNLCSFEY